MQFSKTNGIYKIARITGSEDNILGLCFSENDSNDIEIIEWDLNLFENKYLPIDKPIRTSKNQILKEVLLGLRTTNKILSTNYALSKIYYIPSEPPGKYTFLTRELIIRYHAEQPFN